MADGPSMQDINMYNRQRCLIEGVPVIQQIASLTQAAGAYVAGQATVLNIPLQNVGLIKRLFIEITANVHQSAAETHTLQDLGPANFLSGIQLTDLNNLVRLNTSGYHLSMVNSARRSRPFGAAITNNSPMGLGANYPIITAPATFTTVQALNMFYEIPLAYSDTDLRGAIFANVVNATMNLQLTINPNFSVASTGDGTLACYKSSTTALAAIPSYTITIYQEYIDQLPKNQDGSYAIPMLDVATQYNFITTSYTGITQGVDFPLPYANFRSYMSTLVMLNNNKVLYAGTDLNYFALNTANSMNLFKFGPKMAQLLNGRNRIGEDFPKGVYYFDHRAKPITTLANGNMNLNVNAGNAVQALAAGSIVNVGYEFFALANQLQQAGSIGQP